MYPHRTISMPIILLVAILIPLPLHAAVICVPADQPTIQAGIDAAVDGDTVLVAPGTWTGDGNRDMSFHGKAITVRSQYGFSSCWIDCEGNGDDMHRAFHFNSLEGPSSILQGFTIVNGIMYDYAGHGDSGGALLIENASPTIQGNLFKFNAAGDGGGPQAGGGGAIAIIGQSAPLIVGNRFGFSQVAGFNGHGGGIACIDSSPLILNNSFTDCTSFNYGGGVFVSGGSPVIANCTFYDCFSSYGGGGIFVLDGELLIVNTILWTNWLEGTRNSLQMGFAPTCDPTVTIHHSCIEGGEADVVVDFGTLNWGEGMIDDEPRFWHGPAGEFYLRQVAAGQDVDSPCVDTGDPQSDMVVGTTRSDHVQDAGVVDMGWHHPILTPGLKLVTGPGPSEGNPPKVHLFMPQQDAAVVSEFPAYGAGSWGVNVSCGRIADLENDAIITGAGPGEVYGPHVRGFLPDGTPLPGVSFLAYGTNKWGVNVAAGDLDNDGYDEIVTGAGPGAVFGPHVRGWDVDGGTAAAMAGVSFFAYGTLKYGVNVAAGDLDGDGYDEIVTGAGPGAMFGPHVRGWKVDGGTAAPLPGVSFFAYGTPRWGVRVACGDVDGDGIDELLTAPGPSGAFASHIRGWNVDGGSVVPLDGCSFFAWSPVLPRFGAQVASGTDLDSDGRHEIVVGAGPDPSIGSPVRVFDYQDGTVTQDFSLQAYLSGWTHGVTVAAGTFH